jgi:hypothetical protein
MITPTLAQQNILSVFLKNDGLQSSAVYHAIIAENIETSLVTVKRELTEMNKTGLISLIGAGRSTSYTITTLGRIVADIDAAKYVEVEPDKRYGQDRYNFNLLSEFPSDVFSVEEKMNLVEATKEHHDMLKNTSSVILEKELQRLVIELSWKSSRIEGNTYSLLDTEKLILKDEEAVGHNKDEARMILNHKDAFNFIRAHKKEFKELTVGNIEKLHSILVKDLGVKTGFRKSLVGVTGSKYKPLDNIHQIKEAMEALSRAVKKAKDPYTKALIVLLGTSYIQPFEDGNKRTGRLMANAILMAHDCAPLSYRSVDEGDYRNATLVFYEVNSIVPFKKIFIEQYLFSAGNYAVK